MEQPRSTTQERSLVNIDLTKGVVPTNYNELLQFAQLVHSSGLAPKSLDSPQKVAVAMAMCLEVGRPILTGLQDMAVINGKVGMYGDAVLGVIRASGQLETFEQWEEGEPYTDQWIVYTQVKRKGSVAKTDYWSWLDAKRAGFDQPKTRDGRADVWSPWKRFTRRMMYFKSRNFLLRDEFGDLLRGIQSIEDLQDSAPVEMQQSPETGTWSTPEAVRETQAETVEDLKAKVGKEEPSPQGERPMEEAPQKAPEASPEQPQGEGKHTQQGLGYSNEEPPVHDLEFFPKIQEAKKFYGENKVTEILREKGGWEDPFWIQPEARPGILSALEALGEGTADEIRKEFKDLKAKGLPTFVWKNLERIKESPEAVVGELRDKWQRLIPDAPFPLDAEGQTEEGLADFFSRAPEVTSEVLGSYGATVPGEVSDPATRQKIIAEIKERLNE